MTKFPIMLYNTKNTKKALVPPIPPPSSYEDAVGWSAIEAGYKTALRGSRKFTREAVLYDLYSEVNNVRLWRDLKKIEKTRQAGVSEYTPGKYRHRIIVEPKERSLHIPPLRDKIVQLVIHQELQTLFRPVFVNRSFACMYGKGPIRAAFNVQHDMRVARMKWGDEATVIKIDVRKFFYSIDRSVLKQIIAKRFKKLKKKYPEKYEDFLRFYRLLCKVIDSSPEGERGIPLGNVSSQDFANIYLNELDQFCIRFLGATLYTRYMDDVVIIAPDKEIAREWLAKIKVFLQERLHLETNQKTKIFYVRQGVNAYGFKIKATHLLLRTESKRREKRRIKRMMEKLQEGTITKAAIVQSVNSWLGFARWACAYNLAKKIFAPTASSKRKESYLMAQYLGTVKLGGFYNNGAALARPTKPWRNDSAPSGASSAGNIPSMSGSISNYSFGNTPSDDAKKLQWVKIKDGDKTLLICDRVILVNVTWNDLNSAGWIFGKEVTIDGAKYKLRSLTGGSNYRNTSDAYAGGTPTNNEWDRFITREEVITGLPAPVSSDLDSNLNSTDFSSTHNALWNWAGVYTWCQETYSSNTSYRASRGYYSARLWDNRSATYSNSSVGFRPVLEILNTDPLISDSDRDLGDKNSNFTITYTVDDADSGDVLTATESLDGQTTKSFAPTRNLVNTISVDVDSLSLGKHTVKVVVSDGQGGTATRTWTFTRTNSAPTISGSDGNLGDKNLGFTYAYTIDDADGDTLTVVEELNDETIRTINNAPKGEELTVTITSEKLYALGLNSVNTLKITVTDGKGGTAYRRVTFKRTNSAPTISGQDKALGLKNGSFAENYTVSDVEGDNVVVTEFVDDVQIRSYQATLGQQETIELTREKWLSLTNGQHQLRIEAVDGNFATSVRVFSFSKKETVIKFELAAPEETDAAATKVLVTPTWKIEGAVAKVEACNNGFDAVPTWEDITAMVQINRVYNFTNKTKTASKWGVNIRFTITKNEGFEGEVSISGFGGAYE